MTPFGYPVLPFLAGEVRRTHVETTAARAVLYEHYQDHRFGHWCRRCRALENAVDELASEHASAAFRLDAFIYRSVR